MFSIVLYLQPVLNPKSYDGGSVFSEEEILISAIYTRCCIGKRR